MKYKSIRTKFNPGVLYQLDSHSIIGPNHDGTLILYRQVEYASFGRPECAMTVEVATGRLRQIFHSKSQWGINWLGDGTNTVVSLEKGMTGETHLVAYQRVQDWRGKVSYVIGRISGDVDNLKLVPLKDGSIAFSVTGLTTPDGKLVGCEKADGERPKHSGRVYDEEPVRDLDEYLDPQQYSIFYSTLSKIDDKWSIATPLHNALVNTTLMFDGAKSAKIKYDISEGGIVLAANDTNADGSWSVRQVYHIRLDSFAAASTNGPRKIEVQDDDKPRYSWSPRFSPDGSQVVFLRYSSSKKNHICTYRLGASSAVNISNTEPMKQWSPNPGEVKLSPDNQALYFSAEDQGRVGLYKLDLQSNSCPKALLREGSVESFYPLGKDNNKKILVAGSSLVDNSFLQVIDTDGEHEPVFILSNTNHGASLGISRKQCSEIYFNGASDFRIQAWMIKPSRFEENQKYPLAVLVHGGPKAAWNDKWGSSGLNAALFAEQGYIVVAPNITGSTGFGLEFSEAVEGDWGGRPYEDLVKCMDYLAHIPYIDIDNAVLIGGSYGGYMVNWVQGHPLGRRFKAMVSFCCVFNLWAFLMSSDIRYSKGYWGGSDLIWDSPETIERNNPARPDLLSNWKTPMLVIHGDKDYRCPITEGLGAFRTLQQLGTPSRFLVFPDETHGIANKDNEREYYEQIFAWINKYTGVE